MNRHFFGGLALLFLAFSADAMVPYYRATHFVVANGINQHYVDWGGKGETLLLLAGLGNDAYVFDSFAVRFTDHFHVIGLTRRGFAPSEKPKGGYDTATRVEDIRAFLDALHIRRVHLVGHSLAGDELTLFASKYPDRVLKLVYLDAAYNRREIRQASRGRAPLNEIHAAFLRETEAFRLDYRRVQAPGLAFYAILPANPQKQQEPWFAEAARRQRSSIEQFKREMRRNEVVELQNAQHHLFRGATQDRVVEKTREFLLRDPRARVHR